MWYVRYVRINWTGGIVVTQMDTNRKAIAKFYYGLWSIFYAINPFSAKLISIRREVRGVTVFKSYKKVSQNEETLKEWL